MSVLERLTRRIDRSEERAMRVRPGAPPWTWVLLAAACVFLAIGSSVSAQFAQQTVSGLASGGIYASLALALVLIYRATEVINFAQGEMATFSTYIAWELIQRGFPYWGAFFATLAIAFAGGVVIERTVIRPVEHAPVVTIVIITIGLLILFNALAGWIWSAEIKSFPSAFPTRPITVGGVAFSLQDLGTILVAVVSVLAIWVFFRFTKVGLALRAAAVRPAAARLVGVRVSWMLALGWGLAAMLGAVAGMMVAPVVFLEPNMMQTVLIYAFAAAVLGGIESPAGAVVGGLALGVLLNLLGTYVDFVTSELRLPVALGVLLVVLLIKPSGLFGRAVVRKV
jgi:branched-chain amino acid transport system permease protein